MNKKYLKKFIMLITALMIIVGCSNRHTSENTVVIYTSAEDYRVEYMERRIREEFPDYDIIINYMPTGDHAAKLQSEGTNTDCDITYDLEYGYMEILSEQNEFADISEIIDLSVYEDDTIINNFIVPEYRNGGAIIVNPDVLEANGISEPESYEDLLKPEYQSLISMPSPKSSGTGYMFLKNLVNVLGEDEAFEYFDKLTNNILQYTSSGSGPVNALIQGEVAIGLGMTGNAVEKINNDGANLKIKFFKEGSPYCLYGQAIIAGKENKKAVIDVFKWLATDYEEENLQNFYPEPIFKNKTFVIENFPENITYGDMSNYTYEEKERLLAKWKY